MKFLIGLVAFYAVFYLGMQAAFLTGAKSFREFLQWLDEST